MQREVLGRNTELTSHHQQEEIGKGQRREEAPVHMSCPRPRVLPRGSILTEQCAYRQEGFQVRTLARDGLETHLISIKPKTGSPAAGRSPGPLTLLSSARAVLPGVRSQASQTQISRKLLREKGLGGHGVGRIWAGDSKPQLPSRPSTDDKEGDRSGLADLSA